MTSFTKYEPGMFSWIDLMAKDAAAAKRSYQELCGWDAFYNPTDQGGVYTQFLLRGQPVAGLGEMSDEMRASGMPAVWNSYVTVQDAEASTARAAELGASIQMPPMRIMDVGRMSILADPTGAHFSLWEPGTHVGSGIVNEPCSLTWNELSTNDPERAAAFYRELFGWTITVANDNGYLLIESNGRANGGIMSLGAEREGVAPPHCAVYLAVEDCDASVAKASELAAEVVMPPMDIPQGRFAIIADPQGAMIHLMKVLAPD
jgi:predicted enzyme related to lactoylglutathione lyase